MAYNFPEGAKFLFSQTFAAAKAVDTLSNANPAVAGSTAHGYSAGDEFLLNSGWEDAGDSVYRVAASPAPATNTFGVSGLDATDTNWFTSGGGAGSAQKISNWLEIPQILTISTQGGDPRFSPVSPLARRNSFQVPTGFNASSITLTLGHDASLANYQTMLAVSRALKKVAVKQVLRDGSTSYGYGYMATSEFPGLNNGQPNSVTAVISLIGRAIAYA